MTKERLEEILVEYGVTFTDCLADRLLKEFENKKPRAKECTCWIEYPNEAKKKSNGQWKCLDYECVRPLGKFKTKCVLKEQE